ncbi:MAG TPA: hypothetical protein VHD33_01975 [Legionellaceae bacterium]|nr:hypothetical protein [Legionellaceae bacterium]
MKLEINKINDSPALKYYICRYFADKEKNIEHFQFKIDNDFGDIHYKLSITIRPPTLLNRAFVRDSLSKTKAIFSPLVRENINDWGSLDTLFFNHIDKNEAISCAKKLFELCEIDNKSQISIYHFLEEGLSYFDKQAEREKETRDTDTFRNSF